MNDWTVWVLILLDWVLVAGVFVLLRQLRREREKPEAVEAHPWGTIIYTLIDVRGIDQWTFSAEVREMKIVERDTLMLITVNELTAPISMDMASVEWCWYMSGAGIRSATNDYIGPWNRPFDAPVPLTLGPTDTITMQFTIHLTDMDEERMPLLRPAPRTV